MRQLEKITIKNFKSIEHQTLELRALNLFIGSNGAGKSNLVAGFRFLREIVTQNLAGYTATKGGADGLLFLGRKHSNEMEFFLEFAEGSNKSTSNAYRVNLRGTDDDSLMVAHEIAYFHDKKKYANAFTLPVGMGERESKLRDVDHICARQALRDLESYRVHHFHDTSETSAMKGSSDLEDNRFLRAQAENLPAFLFWLQEKQPNHLRIIEDTIRQIAPFFDGFRLAPSRLNESKIRLEWKQKGTDAYFTAASLSDGTLRFICLCTLLLQPSLPAVVLLDEPELGLHPAAIALLAELLSSAATRTQVLVATQSVTLVNQFGPDEVFAVEREKDHTVFRPLRSADMSQWLDAYSLGDLWEKNILGARP
jgi:predicted ATPase